MILHTIHITHKGDEVSYDTNMCMGEGREGKMY